MARWRRAALVTMVLTGAGCDAIFGVTPGGAEADARPGGAGDGGGVVSDGGRDGAPLEDLDGDNVPDNDDNCPLVANGTQWDEDGDNTGDACDPCPHLVGDVADADGDGVGDDCEPGSGGHQWALFDGFPDPLVLTTCTGVAQLGWWCGRMGGTMAMPSAAGGVLTMPYESVPGGNSLTLLHPIPVTQAVGVVTEIDVGAYDANLPVVAARVLVQASTLRDPGGTAYALCGLNRRANGMQLQAALGGRTATIDSREVPASGVFDVQQVTLVMDRTTLRCNMGATTVSLPLPPTSSQDVVQSIGPAAGLWTVGLGMTAPYFGVIRAQP